VVYKAWLSREFTMIRHVKFAFLAIAFASVPLFASAQTRMMPARIFSHPIQMSRPQVTSRPARTVASRPIIIRLPAAPATQHAQASSQSASSPNFSVFPNGGDGLPLSGATSFDLGQILNNVPGLGFDYSNLVALSGNLGEKAFIDPVTQQDLSLAVRLAQTPGFSGGFIPFWGYGGYSTPVVEEEPQQQQQPQVIVLQQPVASSTESADTAPASEAAAPPQSLLPDVGQFTLVLNNGEKIDAVAFTHQNDQIVYITKDGVRNSFPASDLNVSATRQINQQHGTPLQLTL
jgi:hypothetical protein